MSKCSGFVFAGRRVDSVAVMQPESGARNKSRADSSSHVIGQHDNNTANAKQNKSQRTRLPLQQTQRLN